MRRRLQASALLRARKRKRSLLLIFRWRNPSTANDSAHVSINLSLLGDDAPPESKTQDCGLSLLARASLGHAQRPLPW